MHVSLTACTLILTPRTTGLALLAYSLLFAAAVWVVIGAIAATSWQRSGQAVRTRAA